MRILVTSIVDILRVEHNRIHSLLRHLAQRHDVTVLCLNAWWLDADGCPTKGMPQDPYFRQAFARLNVRYLSEGRAAPLWQEVCSATSLGRRHAGLFRAPMDVHLNYCNLLAGYAVTLRCTARSIPTILDLADDLPNALGASPQVPASLRPLVKRAARWLQRRNAHAASLITVSSGGLIKSQGLPPEKTAIVPNGVDVEFFKPCRSEDLVRNLGLQGKFVVGFVGALQEWVALEVLLEATGSLRDRCPDLRVLIVGDGPGRVEAEEAAKRFRMAERTRFTGRIPYAEVPQYASSMDVAVVPFRDIPVAHGALPLKLLEYMACERPVVSSWLEGVREAVGDQVLYARNPGEWADRIHGLYLDHRLRHEKGRAGREYVRREYSWDAVCGRLEELMVSLADWRR